MLTTVPEVALLAAVAFFTSALTATLGAGGGMLLLGVMLFFMPPAIAIPVHGAVQLLSNAFRTWMFRRHIDLPVTWRFAAALPFGTAVGAVAFQALAEAVIRALIGGAIVVTLFINRLRFFRGREMPLWGFVPLGFVTGILNMIVGVIGPVLGAFLLGRPMTKESIVGTLGLFGVAGNLFKIAGFAIAGVALGPYLPLIAAMAVTMWFGNVAGKRLLARLDETVFRHAFRALLALLALKLIVVDGLTAM